jgi:hypothetical protein
MTESTARPWLRRLEQEIKHANEAWKAGDPCGVCGSRDTYGYAGNAGCNTCHAHDQDGG